MPAGYRVVGHETLGAGIDHLDLRRDDVPQEVHVARLSAAARGHLRVVLAGEALTGPTAGLDTTSSMCARYNCLVGVNGDFVDLGGQPVGAMVASGELVQTPGVVHTQLQLDASGRPSIDDFGWSVQLRRPNGQRVSADAVNRPLDGDGVAVYTSRWGPATPAGTTELVVKVTGSNGARPLPNGSSAARLLELRPGGGPVPPGTVVLAGRGGGANALDDLWARRHAGRSTLVVSTNGARQSVGGSPRLLLDGGPAYPPDDPSAFVRARAPRTLVGSTPQGELLLVTVDGRQPGYSTGVSLAEAADILSGLGADQGVNLDGGGSTTFTTGGRVVNRPSLGAERRITSALVVTAGSAAEAAIARRGGARPGPAPTSDFASKAPGLRR